MPMTEAKSHDAFAELQTIRFKKCCEMWCDHRVRSVKSQGIYRVSINYRRISLRPFTRPDSVWFLPVGFRQGQCLRPATSKDTTRIARAHQHRNRERHTRHAWEGFAGMGVSPGHVPCHTWEEHRMHLKVTMKLQTFLFQMVVTSCISVQYVWKYGFAKSSGNLYASCTLKATNSVRKLFDHTVCKTGGYEGQLEMS